MLPVAVSFQVEGDVDEPDLFEPFGDSLFPRGEDLVHVARVDLDPGCVPCNAGPEP